MSSVCPLSCRKTSFSLKELAPRGEANKWGEHCWIPDLFTGYHGEHRQSRSWYSLLSECSAYWKLPSPVSIHHKASLLIYISWSNNCMYNQSWYVITSNLLLFYPVYLRPIKPVVKELPLCKYSQTYSPYSSKTFTAHKSHVLARMMTCCCWQWGDVSWWCKCIKKTSKPMKGAINSPSREYPYREKKESECQLSNKTWHRIANECKSGLNPFKCCKEHLAY